MKILLALLFAANASPQKSSVQLLKLSAGSLHCTWTNYRPAALTGLHMDCLSSTGSLQQDLVLATGSKTTGQILSDRDSIQWTFQRDTPDGPLLYKISANGKIETGSL